MAKRDWRTLPRDTIYPDKVRSPINFTATKDLRAKLAAATRRLKKSRADVLCLLIDKHADTVQS